MPVPEDLGLVGIRRSLAEVPGRTHGREVRVMGVIEVQESEERVAGGAVVEPVQDFSIDRGSVLPVEISGRAIPFIRGELPGHRAPEIGTPKDLNRVYRNIFVMKETSGESEPPTAEEGVRDETGCIVAPVA